MDQLGTCNNYRNNSPHFPCSSKFPTSFYLPLMAATTARLLTSTTTSFYHKTHLRRHFSLSSSFHFHQNPRNIPIPKLHLFHCTSPSSSSPSFSSSSIPPFSSLSTSSFHSFSSEPAEPFVQWDPEPHGARATSKGDGGARLVVLLGWLGARQKHLRRYAEMYNERGIRSVRFVVPVRELLGLDLGRRIEKRIAELANEIATWCEQADQQQEKSLLFHTFSNTGWLAYGAILENLQSRGDLTGRIRGCIVDSAPVPEISPEVWAAGFCAALLKKNSSLTCSSVESIDGTNLDGGFSITSSGAIRPSLGEIILLSFLQKFFEIALALPDVNGRLKKVISILSEKQPSCPQFYLYSSGDKVIPAKSVENFIEKQRALGRAVYAHDFVSSPHVDHFRCFPRLYSAKVDEFLKISSLVKV